MNKNRFIRIATLAAFVTTWAPAFAADQAKHDPSAASPMSGAPGATGNSQHAERMHQMMQQGMKGMQHMQMTGDMDRDFAMMMKHHHEQGIKMSQMELEHGKDPKMKALAKKIMESQKAEAQEFEQWLASKGKKPSEHPGSPPKSNSHSH